MNPIKFKQGIYEVTLTPPEPIFQDGKWWEPVGVENPRTSKTYFDSTGIVIFVAVCNWDLFETRWIAAEIPTPTPEQLKAIRMWLKHDRPMEAVNGETVWDGKNPIWLLSDNPGYNDHFGHYRWLLESVPEEKEKLLADLWKFISERNKDEDPFDRFEAYKTLEARLKQEGINCEIEQ